MPSPSSKHPRGNKGEMWVSYMTDHLRLSLSCIIYPHFSPHPGLELRNMQTIDTVVGGGENPAAAVISTRSGRSMPTGMLAPPRMLPNNIELSIHSCTKSMIREVSYYKDPSHMP